MAIDPDGVSRGPARRAPLTARGRLFIILVMLGIACLAVVLVNLMPKQKRPDTTTAHGVTSGIPYSTPTQPAVPAAPKAVPHPMVAAPAAVRQMSFTPTKDNALEATMFSTGGTSYNGNEPNARGARRGDGDAEKDDEFTNAMTASSVGAAAKAKRMKHPSLTIPAGIVIPCILQTAINSELIGFVDCNLPSEVRSADGTVTLLDKGSQVMGQIKSGLRRGQDRLFILWTRARTPDNVTVDLASPGADELGRSGVDGYVNTHFWKMFWTAALFSLIEYGPQLATAAIQNANKTSGSVNNYTTFLTPQQSLANTILQDDLHIPPTLEKNQGDVVSIFVARDLDFSGVYDLRTTSPAYTAPVSIQAPVQLMPDPHGERG